MENVISLNEYVLNKERAQLEELEEYVKNAIEEAGGYTNILDVPINPYVIYDQNDNRKIYDIDGVANSLMNAQVVLELIGRRDLSDTINSVVADLLGIDEE